MNTPVIFRKFRNGEVIAIFPSECGTNDPSTCSSYQHIGQHGSCDPAYLVSITKPAQITEWRNLERELIGQGYDDLEPMRRISRKHYQTRKKTISGARSC